MTPLAFMRRHVRAILIACVLVIALATTFGYALGYRLAPGPSILKAHALTVTGLPDGTIVYVDSGRSARAANGRVSLLLTGGTHTLIAEADGYWPWNELVPVKNADVSVSALMARVPAKGGAPSLSALAGAQAEAAKTAFASARLPTADAPLLLAGGCAKTYVSDNRIIADPVFGVASCAPPAYLCESSLASEGVTALSASACSPTVIFAPVDTLRSVVPFPGRDDALLVAIGGAVYALELDPLDPRYFAPVYAGNAPVIAPENGDGVFLRDKGAYYRLAF